MTLLRTLLIVLLAGGAATPAPCSSPKSRAMHPLIGPRIGSQRDKALRQHGGNSATEKAVEAGLDWLRRHQSPSGGWDADGFHKHCEDGGKPCTGKGKGQHGEEIPCPFDGAISALATLAFLGHGHGPDQGEGPIADTVEKAFGFVRGSNDVWSLPIATQAIAEAQALFPESPYQEELELNVSLLLAAQGKDGGWGYAPVMGRGSDVPYTVLVVQALAAAESAGIQLPDELRGRVDTFLSSLELKKGRLGYLLEGRRFGYSPTSENGASAAAIRELLHVGVRMSRHKSHLSRLSREKPKWRIGFKTLNVPGRGLVKAQIGHLSMVRWWYGTIATFHAGGSAWTSWFASTKKTLLSRQEKRGCERGSWDPVGLYERQTGGRVFATALGVLMLEQPYRHHRRW